MARSFALWCLALPTFGLGVGQPSQAGEQKIVLEDHIKLKWSGELVTFPFEAAEGQCHRDSVTLVGPRGPVACQFSDIVCRPGSKDFVKSAKLSFIVDLAPLARDPYTVRYGTTAAKGPETDLSIKPGKDRLEITTKRFGAKLLLGRKRFSKPVKAADVTGPIVAIRRGDDKWFDGSHMYGKTKIVGYSSELVESGAVFAEVAVRYTYENGNTLDLTLHVAAGDSAILVDANVKKDDRQSGWHMVVAKASRPLVWRMVTERKGTNKWPGMPKYDKIDTWIDIPLADAPAGTVTTLTPWSDCSSPECQEDERWYRAVGGCGFLPWW